MKKIAIGIRTQLIAGIVLTTLAGIGLIGILSVKIIENSAVYWKVSEAETIVRFIAAAMRFPSASGNTPEESGYVLTALKEAKVLDYRLASPDGRVIAMAGSLPGERGGQIPYGGDIRVWRIGGGLLTGPGEKLYISALLDSGRGRLGNIDFTVSLDEINADLAGARKFLLLYAVFDSVIIIGLGAYFLSRSITRPIKKLDQAAIRIAKGSLAERARVSVDNEIGSLARSFNIMADRLEDEIKSLERVNRDLVNAQEELLRSSTLAVVGRLAAGIAHEIGNPLGAVRGYLDILSKGPLDKDEEKEIIERTAKEVSRIDLIVREFLDISRPSKKAPDRVDVNRLLAETVSTISVHRDMEDVATEVSNAPSLPPVLIDESKLRQVFVNLIINASHAMFGRDTRVIRIETGTDMRAIGPHGPRRRKDDGMSGPGLDGRTRGREFVYIRFKDTGVGVSDEDAAKIFEPFYSTKDVGKGTGLGLFVSQSIIKAYGGEITLETKPGEGSTFTVLLPAIEDHEDTDN